VRKYSLQDIEKTFKEKSWWAIVMSLTPAKYITYYFANNTKITPNQVTLLSLFFAIISGLFFYFHMNILGALFFQISYIFDIVDGSLARVKNLTSSFGHFLDISTDWLKMPLLISILLYKTDNINYLILILILLYLYCLINKYNDELFYKGKKNILKSLINGYNTENKHLKYIILVKYINFFKKRNLYFYPTLTEFENFILFLYAIFQDEIFILISVIILILNISLKLFAVIKKTV